MKKIALLIFFTFIGVSLILSQESNKTLLTIDGEEITKKEFLRVYNKNTQNINSGEKTDIDEYLDLFIDFKLKITEAKNQRFDTISSVKEEIQKHKRELAKPYLVDNDILDSLVREAYKRSQKEVKASHILIKFPNNLTYEDTAFTYKKAKNIRKRLNKKGEPFKEVARATSDDPSVKKNGGDLGYFTALQMVYPFENKVYKMETEKLSKPVRTKYGYHIIKKTDERKAKGEVRVAHIMLLAPESMPEEKRKEKKEKINEIYHDIMGGAAFDEMARKHSDDKGSANQDGKLPWFSTGRMVPEFEEAAFSLEEKGQVTSPIRTSIGWHIIKLLDKRQLGSFEEEKKQLTKKVTNNPRYSIARDSLIEELKKTYRFSKDDSLYERFASRIIKDNEISPSSAKDEMLQKKIIEFEGRSFTLKDFKEYQNQAPKEIRKKLKGRYFLDEAFKEFSDEKLIDYEREKLPEKHPEYKYTFKEYKEGILLFEIMDRKVWSKAAEDTSGLKEYFNNNRDNYKWDERFKGKIYLADNKKILKEVKKLKKGGLFRKSWSDKKILNKYNTDGEKKIEIKEGTYLRGENKIIDQHAWDSGQKEDIDEKRPYFVKGELIPPQNKTLDEARGGVLADYQNYLEEQWIQELKNKYEVEVNKQVLENLKN
ncbi:MAG: foldase protein PrsA [Bacteroidota bacterium]